MSEIYDAVILGAGHHGLILQAYLARAGLRTICLERRMTAGGGLTTIERPVGSGMLHNTHSFYHRGLTQMPWYVDLELERHGAQYIEPEFNVAMLLPDGRVLAWWTDFDKTAASVSQFSRRDADALRRWREEFQPIVRNILTPEAQAPPLPPVQRWRFLSRSRWGRRLLEVSRLSPLEFVLQEFEHPAVQAGLLFFNGLREVDLRCRGFGHHIAALLASDAMAQMCVGGSQTLADALIKVVREAGGEIRLGVELEEIVVTSGRVTGVKTTDGQLIEATKLVASNLNPGQTFLELLAPAHVPDPWRQRAAAFQYNLLAPLFSLHVCLREPPRYQADCESIDDALMVILGLDHIERFFEITRCHESGRIGPTVMWGSCPTRFDPSQAPPNRHTAFMWEKLPYRLHGDPACWDAVKETHGQAMLQLWKRRAPNLECAVKHQFTQSPLDVERALWNMREGDLLVGAFANGQIGYHRPFPGAGHYRTHLPGLYLCGSCCHPGGNITGLAGYNAAQVILADLGLPAPWAPPPLAEKLASLSRTQ